MVFHPACLENNILDHPFSPPFRVVHGDEGAVEIRDKHDSLFVRFSKRAEHPLGKDSFDMKAYPPRTLVAHRIAHWLNAGATVDYMVCTAEREYLARREVET